MCRNIKQLYNFDPPATEAEIKDAVDQFVRKVSGMAKPSAKNLPALETASTQISASLKQLFADLETSAQPKNREVELQKARARNAKRFPVI